MCDGAEEGNKEVKAKMKEMKNLVTNNVPVIWKAVEIAAAKAKKKRKPIKLRNENSAFSGKINSFKFSNSDAEMNYVTFFHPG